MIRALPGLLLFAVLTGCGGAPEIGDPQETAANENEAFLPLMPTGRVTDAAEVLPPDVERKLSGRLEMLEIETRAQLVVVTTSSLDGLSVEDYARTLANGWGVGSAERNDGLLILVAPKEKQVRLEVGTGLEEVVTNNFAQMVVDEMMHHFREGQFGDGLAHGIARLGERLREPQFKEAA
ncbi:TPM domain-containing protein [Qipengyuania sphaerica]|uniref:TPM domain-containing protein n=1 Tax=Qipengyuania sphaerica TaxID=2867243 RepID=UPI001C88A7BA|nr:TPM domain-containing protein [Qipengyuania sphaerica]MBX7540115.1 TPM domain-containing protein [Qipengyuania sphaerica]